MALVWNLVTFFCSFVTVLCSPSIVPEYVAGIPVWKVQQGENWQAAPAWSIPNAFLNLGPRSVHCTTPGATCIDCETLRVCNKFHKIVIEKSCSLSNPDKPFCNMDRNECSATTSNSCEDQIFYNI